MRRISISHNRGRTHHQPGYLAALLIVLAQAALPIGLLATDPSPPAITNIYPSGPQLNLQFAPYPGAETYTLLSSPNLDSPFAPDPSFVQTPNYLTNYYTNSVGGSNVITTNVQTFYTWRSTNTTNPNNFYALEVVPMSSNSLLSATVLNRLAYGPTPDELERVRSIGPDAYIAEQLAPENIADNLPFETVTTNFGSGWQQFIATGTANSSASTTWTNLFIYLTVPGDCFIDDIKVVAGTNAGVGANLVRNGDFELPLDTNDWVISANHAASGVAAGIAHSGTKSLHVVASSGGTTQGSAIWQPVMNLASGTKYTLSYWFLPSLNNQLSSLTVRFSGSWDVSAPYPISQFSKLNYGAATIDDLRAWHALRGVQSKRQLLEVLDQFLENHFVTQYSKSSDFFTTYYSDGNITAQIATQLEFKENGRWRQALMNPQCTFYDLLKISAESTAMIIYLDTVNSKGNGSNVANENYARELQELFTLGVDNGYDQNDITVMSRAWTGWSVNLMAATNEFNPLAADLRTLNPGVNVTNLVGVWAFQYKQGNHNTNSKTIYPNKTVPARFGAPYAGKSYQLVLPSRNGTNGISDGYDVLTHLANQPFTQEYISVKLCRLFVHDDFVHGVYDYTDPNLSPEGQLVHQCMVAWENPPSGGPKGQIRDVLRVIFNSDLFRSYTGSMQKVKTPLEYLLSSIRALRAANTDGTFTATLDSTSSGVGSPLSRMGSMLLFDRAEPNGYPEAGPAWISAGTLAERLRFIQAYLIAPGQSGRGDAGNSTNSPVALIQLKLPSANWNNAGLVADYFLDILFPGEGKANLDVYRTEAINFLNDGSADASTTTRTTVFSGLPVSAAAGSSYDTRVRGMVAMLMTSQRFQEQ